MSDRDDPRLEAVERRLAVRACSAAPPGHRDRVLAAVRDTLDGRATPAVAPAAIDSGGRAALVAMALSTSLVIVAPWVAMTRPAALVPTEPLIVARARAAGIDLPVAAVVATNGPLRELPARAGADDVFNARRIEAWRLRNLIEGEL